MAMGNYPFASSYMGGALPPWPMRAACDILGDEDPSDGELLRVRPLCYPAMVIASFVQSMAPSFR